MSVRDAICLNFAPLKAETDQTQKHAQKDSPTERVMQDLRAMRGGCRGLLQVQGLPVHGLKSEDAIEKPYIFLAV